MVPTASLCRPDPPEPLDGLKLENNGTVRIVHHLTQSDLVFSSFYNAFRFFLKASFLLFYHGLQRRHSRNWAYNNKDWRHEFSSRRWSKCASFVVDAVRPDCHGTKISHFWIHKLLWLGLEWKVPKDPAL